MASQTAKLDCVSESFGLEYFRTRSLSKRSKERGYTYFVLGYIFSVKLFMVSENEVDIRCQSYRSMRKSEAPHTVNITIVEKEKHISSSHCTCQAGTSGTCAHVVGLVHTISHFKKMGLSEVPADLSVTSLPQQWHKPRGSKIRPAPVVAMVMAKPTDPTSRKRKPVMAKLSEQRIPSTDPQSIKHLKSMKTTPLSYLLTDKAPEENTTLGPVQLVSSLIYHVDRYKTHKTPVVSVCGVTAFPLDPTFDISEDITKLSLTPITQEEAIDLEQATRKQSGDDKWFQARDSRITASQFHKIMKRQRLITDKFTASILFQKQFSSVPTTYGKWSEEGAKRAFTETNLSVHVHDCGLVINPKFSFLGATPDGKVCDMGQTGILEIKCPYTARDLHLKEASTKIKQFCLIEGQDNSLTINKNHDHYIQIQGQLLVTGAPFCDYVVHTRKDTLTERIYPDIVKQMELLNKCVEFYQLFCIPAIHNHQALNSSW